MGNQESGEQYESQSIPAWSGSSGFDETDSYAHLKRSRVKSNTDSMSTWSDWHTVEEIEDLGVRQVVGYLLPTATLLQSSEIPKFDEIANPYAVYDWEDTPRYIFISHLCCSALNVDDKLHTKLNVIKKILNQMKHIEYLWIDCSCVPDDKLKDIRSNLNMMKIINNSVRVVIIPLRSTSLSKAPKFDVAAYSKRAWCAFEFSIALARHPSKVRIARIIEVEKGQDYKLQFISLPTHDKQIGLEHLISRMSDLRKFLEEDDKKGFWKTFYAHDSDKDFLWKLLQCQKIDIFNTSGVRRNSDFFVRTEFASKFQAHKSEQLIDMYDKEALANMDRDTFFIDISTLTAPLIKKKVTNSKPHMNEGGGDLGDLQLLSSPGKVSYESTGVGLSPLHVDQMDETLSWLNAEKEQRGQKLGSVKGYLLPKADLLESSTIPNFHEINNPYHVYDWKEAPKYVFFSHRYLSDCRSDDAFQTKLRIIKLILKQMKQIEYLWIDVSCIPAGDSFFVEACINMFDIISQALRVFIIPLKSTSITRPPAFDLDGYSNRAWCAFEYSIVLARHPSKIRITKIIPENQGEAFKLQLISLPTHDQQIGVDQLVSRMQELREMLEGKNKLKFQKTFSASIESDKELLWDLLKTQQYQIFNLAGCRRNSDFFVRTEFASKFAAKRDEKLCDIYDEKIIEKISQGNPKPLLTAIKSIRSISPAMFYSAGSYSAGSSQQLQPKSHQRLLSAGSSSPSLNAGSFVDRVEESKRNSVFFENDGHQINKFRPVVGYLIHKSSFAGISELPRFHEINNPYHVYCWEDAPEYIFVSHLHLSASHTDDQFQTKCRIIELVLRQMKQVDYIWIDFCCIPDDDAHRIGACSNLFDIITNAARSVIIPLRSVSASSAPVFDLEAYSKRAWCAFEYSVILVNDISKIRITKMIQNDVDYRLLFLSLPKHIEECVGVHHLMSGMNALNAFLKSNDERRFRKTFQTSVESDYDLIWDLFKVQENDIFSHEKLQMYSSSFQQDERCAPTSVRKPEKAHNIYDKETIGKMNSVSKFNWKDVCGNLFRFLGHSVRSFLRCFQIRCLD